jgi:putative peptide zinc metalloprotease protein
VLAVLVSPDLEHKLQQARVEEALLRWEVEQQAFDGRLREQGVALRKRWDAARQTVAGLMSQIAQLTILAPFDGTAQSAEEGLAAGMWLPRGERLFDVIGPSGIKGDAFVAESDVGRITTGQPAAFVASLSEMGTLHCRAVAVDRVNLTTLDANAMASVYGGPVPAQLQPGTHQLVPLQATYRVRLGQCTGATVLMREITGTATIGSSGESFAWRGMRALLAVVSREAGL